MSYPVPGEFPDFEHFMVDLLTGITPNLPVTFLPSAIQQANLPLIWVRKTGGTLDGNAITYRAQVQVVIFGTDRPTAQNLAISVRDAFLAAPASRTPAPNGVLIDYVEETTVSEPKFHAPILRHSRGLTDLPDLDPMSQVVELAFALDARRQ